MYIRNVFARIMPVVWHSSVFQIALRTNLNLNNKTKFQFDVKNSLVSSCQTALTSICHPIISSHLFIEKTLGAFCAFQMHTTSMHYVSWKVWKFDLIKNSNFILFKMLRFHFLCISFSFTETTPKLFYAIFFISTEFLSLFFKCGDWIL